MCAFVFSVKHFYFNLHDKGFCRIYVEILLMINDLTYAVEYNLYYRDK